MTISVKSFNAPWFRDYLAKIDEWWGIPFDWNYTDYADELEFQPYSDRNELTDAFVARYLTPSDVNLFFAPQPSIPHFLGIFQAWNSVIQAFVNKGDTAYFGELNLGDAVLDTVNHELSHYFYQHVLKIPDNTHRYFYTGQSALAHDEIKKAMNPYNWDTKEDVRHSIRVMCDEANLRYLEKQTITACIYQESGFNPKAVGKPNANGTVDYGLCQFNNGTNKNGMPYWIGEGAAFSTVEEVLDNPEKNVRIMIEQFKLGHIYWWSSFATGAYKKWLPFVNKPITDYYG